MIEAAHLGAEELAAELLQPLCDLRPELDTFAAVPPAALGRLNMEPENPVPYAAGGPMLDELPPAAIDAINAQLDVLADALKPWDSGVRLANFVEVPIDARTFYPLETFDRLQAVKRRYDPDGLFHANHPIPSSAATERNVVERVNA